VTGGRGHLPMFPLGTVLLPGAALSLHVFEDRYRALVGDCLAGDGCFGVVLIERGSEVGGGDRRVAVGTEAHIELSQRFDDGRWALVARGGRRVEVVQWLAEVPYPSAEVRSWPDGPTDVGPSALASVEKAVRRVRTLASELGRAPALDDRELEPPPTGARNDEPPTVARLWRLCEAAPFTAVDRQRLIAAPDPPTRAALLGELADALGDDLAAML